mmetsp:Transcript_2317/g.3503  ORF Transcript_2317/g.3503 Transcript_2317/m.3503 type:complete len:340 (+) Transcript_2317:1594-2613(+)
MPSNKTPGRTSTRVAGMPGWSCTVHGASSAEEEPADRASVGTLSGSCHSRAARGTCSKRSGETGSKTECSCLREANKQRVPRASLRPETSSHCAGSCLKMALPDGRSGTEASRSGTASCRLLRGTGAVSTAVSSLSVWSASVLSASDSCSPNSSLIRMFAGSGGAKPASSTVCTELTLSLKALSNTPPPAPGACPGLLPARAGAAADAEAEAEADLPTAATMDVSPSKGTCADGTASASVLEALLVDWRCCGAEAANIFLRFPFEARLRGCDVWDINSGCWAISISSSSTSSTSTSLELAVSTALGNIPMAATSSSISCPISNVSNSAISLESPSMAPL